MTQAHHIKYLYEVKNKSLNSISKETGFDFRTVKKYVEKQDWNERQTRNKPSKIESVVFCKSEFPVFARIPNNFPPGKFVNEFSLANS